MDYSLSNALTIMRRVISRRNANDPDSSDSVLTEYINLAYRTIMAQDVRLFEQNSTLEFTIDTTNTTGVYEMKDSTDPFYVPGAIDFQSQTIIAYCDNQPLYVYQDPKQFYDFWNEFDTTKITKGQPTDMLYYGTEIVFRTIQDDSYTIRWFGYKRNQELSGNPNITEQWFMYIIYTASLEYALNFKFNANDVAKIKAGLQRHRKFVLADTHNQIKVNRSFPRF